MKKLTALFLALVMVICCTAFASAENAKPYDGVTINVLGNSSVASTYMQENIAKFTEETGIKVNYEQLTNDQLNTRILVSMAAGGKDLDAFMFMAYQNTTMYVQNGWLEPLDSYIDEEFNVADFLASGIEASSVDGVLYGIPHGSEYTCYFYNKTMLNEAGIDASTIKTFDDLVAALATIEEKLPGTHGIALRGSGYGAAVMVPVVARSYGGTFYDENGKAAINTPEWVKGTEVYCEMLKYAQEGASAMSWSETCNVFAQKQTAFRMDADAQYTYLIDPDSSLVGRDELGFMVPPTGDVKASSSSGNWSIGISAGSQNKGAAWEFVRWMNTEAACKEQVIAGAPLTRTSNGEDPEVAAMFPEGYMDYLQGVCLVADGATLPDMTYSSEFRTLFGEGLDAIFEGGDIQTILDECNAGMQELLDQEAAEKAE